MSKNMNEAEFEPTNFFKKKLERPKPSDPKDPVKPVEEMGAGGVAGFQLPLGAHKRKEEIKRCVESSGDLSEAHLVVFFGNSDSARQEQFFEALDFMQDDAAADMVREEVVRMTVRQKISEVVRKKQGGGGYVLYAPNKGKKHNSKPVGSFPTKLAAKRAELARFPPKDPGKLRRLRKEVDKLMKDPKKRAEAERKAAKAKGTETGSSMAKKPVVKKHEGVSRDLVERALISNVILKDINEGLFREERAGSGWDEFIGKISSSVLKGDKGFQRFQAQMTKATEASLAQAAKIIQRSLGSEAKVKASKAPSTTDSGVLFMPFHVVVEAASVGPIYLYIDKGLPAIEMSDEAKNSLTKITPGSAKAIRAALAAAQDNLEKISAVSDITAQRDAYLEKMETMVDKMIANMSPLQVSMMKQLLVKKYRSMTK